MPEAKKVSWAQLRIGVMAAGAMVILAVLIFLLTGSGNIFRSDATLYTYMDDAAAMNNSTPVRLNGITVGKIDEIKFSGLKERGKVVVIKMSVYRDMLSQIPDDSIAGVDAANLLGDKFINIAKGKSASPIRDKGTLTSKEAQDIPELMTRAGDILGAFQVTVKRFDDMLADIQAGRGNLGKLLTDEELFNEVKATTVEARKLVASMNSGKGLIPRLINDEQFVEEVRSPIRRFDSLVAGVERGEGSLGKFVKDPALHDQFVQTVADVRRLVNVDLKKIVDDLNAGRGTAGKLLKDEEFYRRINQLVTNLNNTMDKINSGQGTFGQMLVNQQLYDSLNGATREMQGLLKDIRTNPKKFLRIKLGLF